MVCSSKTAVAVGHALVSAVVRQRKHTRQRQCLGQDRQWNTHGKRNDQRTVVPSAAIEDGTIAGPSTNPSACSAPR